MPISRPHGICGAKTRSGGVCTQAPVKGRERCRMHGGTVARGLAHHATKHGRRSKHMPTRLKANYEAALTDPQLHALDDEIALVDARITELVADLSGGVGDQNHWALLSASWDDLDAANRMAMDNPMRGASIAAALSAIGSIIRAGRSEHATWREIGTQIERKARLLESRNRLAGVYTAEQVLLMVGSIAEIVMRNVDDRDVRARIARETEITLDLSGRLLSEPAGG